MEHIVSQNFAEMVGLNSNFCEEDEEFNTALYFAQALNSMLEAGIIKFMS